MADGEHNKAFEQERDKEPGVELSGESTEDNPRPFENQQRETSLSLEGGVGGSDTPSPAQYDSDPCLEADHTRTPGPAQYDSDVCPEADKKSVSSGTGHRDELVTSPISRPSTKVSRSKSKFIAVQEGIPSQAVWESKWNQSPYTYKGLQAQPSTAASPRTQGTMTPQAVQVEFNIGDDSNGTGRSTETNSEAGIFQMVPPMGHFGDFYTPEELGQRGYYSDDSDSDDDGFHLGYFVEENISLDDKSTMFGQLKQQFGPEVPINTETTRKQARNGLKLAQQITKVPLSKLWHAFSEIFVLCVFFANVVVGIYDIIRDANYLYYKVSAIVFGVLENLILLSMWFIARHPRFKKSDDYKIHLKRMQYAENITAEILMYVVIIITLFGFATEKMYQTPGDAFGWIQLILLIFDVVEILFTNAMRLYMLYRLMKDLKGVLEPDEKKAGCCSNSNRQFAGGLIPRAYATVVGNLLLLFLIAGMLGVQVWKDNFTSEDYHATINSGLLLILLILIPILGNALFVLINAYWIIEVLLKLNLKVGQSKDHLNALGENYGQTVAGALEFAQEKFKASDEKLTALNNTKTWQKTLYGLGEIPVLLLIFFYEVMCILAIYFFDGFSQNWLNIFMKALFIVVMMVANYHLCLLMFLSNFAVLILFISVFIYPLIVPPCCRRKSNIMDEYKKFKGNAIKIK